MNKHEKTYRSTGRLLNLLFIAWILCVGLVSLAPAGIRDSDWRYISAAFFVVSLFTAIFILGILKSVAYIR